MGYSTELVITGAGVISPIGIGRQPFWESLRDGRSGVRSLDWLAGTRWPVRFGADVRDFEAKKYVKPRKSLKVMCREIQFGFSAATLALEDARLDPEQVDSDRFGVVCGSEMFYGDPHDLIDVLKHCRDENGNFDEPSWGEQAMGHLYPLWMLMYLPNMVACHLAIAQDARGPNNTICVGEASGLLSLMEAADAIDRGLADVMIVGGAGSRLNVAVMIHRGDIGLSHRNEDPAAASRPFDAGRDGMVNGEGAAALILESRRHAEARGAPILATLAGGGRSYGAPARRADGLRRAIRGAMEGAGCAPEQLSHVNAEGLSGDDPDRQEAAALADCLGQAPVFAPKSYFGNLGGGTGVVELAASLCALEQRIVPATLNYQQPDPDCPVNVVAEATPDDRPWALAVNQSSTGQAAAVVLRRE